MLAAFNGHTEALKLLLANGAIMTEALAFLLANGANVTAAQQVPQNFFTLSHQFD
jgi:ankyrin repeat protein